MSALGLFGVGVTIVGAAAVSILVQAARDVFVVAGLGREPADWPAVAMLISIAAVDLVIVVAGATIALLEM